MCYMHHTRTDGHFRINPYNTNIRTSSVKHREAGSRFGYIHINYTHGEENILQTFIYSTPAPCPVHNVPTHTHTRLLAAEIDRAMEMLPTLAGTGTAFPSPCQLLASGSIVLVWT